MPRLRSTLAAALDVRPGDGWPLLLLLVHSFFYGISLVFIETPANTLFLAKFSVKSLPWVYVLTAVVSTALGLGYARLEARLPPGRLLAFTLLALTVATAAVYGALLAHESRWLVLMLMVWKDVQWVLAGVEFWALAGLLFNVRQGKRLFGLVSGGEVVAGILGGLCVPSIVTHFGTLSLVLLSALATAASLGVLLLALRRFHDRLAPAAGGGEDAARERDTRPLWALCRERFLFLLFVLSALSYVSFYFIDYVFYDRVEQGFPDEMKLASFFGIFFAALGGVELVSKTFLSGRLLTRYGLGFGLLALPLVDMVTGGAAAGWGLALGLGAVFLWLVVGIKLVDEVLRSSLLSPAFRILYQPLPAGKRLRIQAVRESIVEPIALGLSGVLLLLLTSVLALGAVALLGVILGMLAACVVLGLMLRREYTAVLVGAVSKRRLRGLALSVTDESTLAVLRRGLDSRQPAEVIYCLNILEENDHEEFEPNLLRLLDHPAPAVREHVLVRVRRRRLAAAAPHVARMAAEDPAPAVRGQALRAWCALEEADAVDRVVPYAADPAADPEVRTGALVGLLQGCGIDGVLVAGARLQALMVSPDPADRRTAARVLGDVGIKSFSQPLLRLVADGDADVRRAALEAAGRLKDPRLVATMVAGLSDGATGGPAAGALARFGEGALPGLAAVLEGDDQPRAVRARVAQVCGRIGGERAAAVLRAHWDSPDLVVRDRVLSALVMCGYRAEAGADAAEVERLVRREVAEAAWALAAVADVRPEDDADDSPADADAGLPTAGTAATAPTDNDWGTAGGDREEVGYDAPSAALLTAALLAEVRANQGRALSLLSFVYPADSILQAKLGLASDSPERWAGAVEVIDNLVGPDVKAWVLPLLDDLSPEQRLSRLGGLVPQRRLGRAGRLRELVARPSARSPGWTKLCALYAAGRVRARGFEDAILPALDDPDAVVRETAAWALHATGSEEFRRQVHRLRDDPSQLVLRAARRLEASLPTRGLETAAGAAAAATAAEAAEPTGASSAGRKE